MVYDVMQRDIGACQTQDIAARVLTRIIGHYPKQNMLCVCFCCDNLGWGVGPAEVTVSVAAIVGCARGGGGRPETQTLSLAP